MKPRLLLARLYDICHYSWKAARANRFPKISFIKNKLSDRMIKQLLNSVIAKTSWKSRKIFDLDDSAQEQTIMVKGVFTLYQIALRDKKRYPV